MSGLRHLSRTGVIGLVILALAILAPLLVGKAFYINIGSQVLIAAIFAMSLNVIVGWGGLNSLGHAAYLGAAAYGVALLTLNSGWSFYPAAAVSVLGTTLMAGLFGAIALRGSGITFLMITLALGQTLWGVVFRWSDMTGGDNGLPGIKRPMLLGLDLVDPTAFYAVMIVLFAVALFAMWVFSRSGLGLSLQGTRDQPRRMGMLGHNVWLVRWFAFILSGFWAAIAGVAFVAYHGFIHPQSLSLSNSAEALLMVIAGGAGTLLGPVVGATIVVLLKMVASAYVTRWVLLLGITFILIVMFLPEGVAPGLAWLITRATAKRPPAATSAREARP
jgi:branched-chain amino acid transport system permease protein